MSAGEVITTVGVVPRLTVTLAGVLPPKALVQTPVLVLLGELSLYVWAYDLVEAAPLTVQVVPAGMVDPPLTV